MKPKTNGADKTANENQRVVDAKVSRIYTPAREDCRHGYRLATKARFIGLCAEHGNRARKVADILHDPEAELVYIIDEVSE